MYTPWLFILIGVIFATLTTQVGYAQTTYKCKVQGKTVYQDTPCFAGSSEPAKTNKRTTEPSQNATEEISSLKNQIELLKKEEAERQRKAEAKAAEANKRTALDFDCYTNIRRGMNTQEVWVKTGPPTNKDFAERNPSCQLNQVYESWLYPADSVESNNTIVEFCDGMVVNVKRFK